VSFKNFFEQDSTDILLERYFSLKNETLDLLPLTHIFQALQKEDVKDFIDFLKSNPEIKENLIYYIKNVFKNRTFNLSLTEANILSESAFVPELRKRTLAKFLPPVEEENTISSVISEVFFRDKADFKYIKNVPKNLSHELFRILEIDKLIILPKVKKELIFSMNILAWRVVGNALEVDVLKMAPEYKDFDNPFLALQKS
jgi:site-specific recombinase